MVRFFVLLVALALAYGKRFDGDQVLTLHPKTAEHLRLINEFGSSDEIADFWSPDSADLVLVGKPVDVRFKAADLQLVKRKLNDSKMKYDVKISNLQAIVDAQFKKRKRRQADYDYSLYHTFEEISQWSKDIAKQYASLARCSMLTTSSEGREIPMLTIGKNSNNPIFVIDCGMHAREWISPAVCQCFVNHMLSEYGHDPEVTKIMDKLAFVVVPLLNVDGYAYSWSHDRMWTKTRSNYGTTCTGVNPNRNFDANWSGPGSYSNPCSVNYYGPSVESEPSVKGLADYLRGNNNQVKAYVTLRSYGQYIIYPYSYNVIDADNNMELDTLAKNSTEALQAVYGKEFSHGVGYELKGMVSGISDDFAKDNGVPIVYTIKLRDVGRYGYVLPENLIEPSCNEIYPAMKVIANHIIDNYS